MNTLPNVFELTNLNCVIWPSGIKVEEMAKIESLCLKDIGLCEIRSLPESIGHLNNLTSLDLSGCSSLVSLPERIGSLVNLTTLDLSGCSELRLLPECIGNLTKLTSLNLTGCQYLRSVPESVGNLTELTSLELTDCFYLQSLPESIGNLHKITSVHLRNCFNIDSLPNVFGLPHLKFIVWPHGQEWRGIENIESLSMKDLGFTLITSLPASIENLKKLKSLDLSECVSLRELPESIGNLSELTSLNLNGASELGSLPESIGNLHKLRVLDLTELVHIRVLPESIGNLHQLISLDLSRCYNLESLPDSIGNLHKLTSLRLTRYSHITSLPTSLRNLTHLQTPLSLAYSFYIPPDLDWNQFGTSVTLPSYLEYMMRMNQITTILVPLFYYIRRFDPDDSFFVRHRVSHVYGLIQGRREGGGDLIRHFCSMLTNDRMGRGRGYSNRIEQMCNDENKRKGMECFRILFLLVNGVEMKRKNSRTRPIWTGRRMREVWMGEGKDEEGRNEWKRRWRETRDVIMEEDASKIFSLSLCVTESAWENARVWNIPSDCSLISMYALRYDGMGYHFPSYPLPLIPQDSVIVHITPWDIHTSNENVKWSIASMLMYDGAEGRGVVVYHDLCMNTPYIVLQLQSRKDAKMLVHRMNGRECNGYTLSLSQGQQSMLKTFLSRLFS